MSLIILGIDPGSRIGWALLDPIRAGSHQIAASASEHAGAKLDRLAEFVSDLCREHKPDAIWFEKASGGAKGFNDRIAHAEKEGIVKLVAYRLGLPAHPAPISSVKKFATGNGHARKPQMIAAAKTIHGIDFRGDSDAADAFWVAMYGAHSTGVRRKTTKARRRKPRPSPPPTLF